MPLHPVEPVRCISVLLLVLHRLKRDFTRRAKYFPYNRVQWTRRCKWLSQNPRIVKFPVLYRCSDPIEHRLSTTLIWLAVSLDSSKFFSSLPLMPNCPINGLNGFPNRLFLWAFQCSNKLILMCISLQHFKSVKASGNFVKCFNYAEVVAGTGVST